MALPSYAVAFALRVVDGMWPTPQLSHFRSAELRNLTPTSTKIVVKPKAHPELGLRFHIRRIFRGEPLMTLSPALLLST